MTKSELISIAEKLKQPSEEAQIEFFNNMDVTLSELNETMLSRPDLVLLIGENNETMMLDNHRNLLRFMNSMFIDYNPEILVETVLWVFRVYSNHGFNFAYWPTMLNEVLDILRNKLSRDSFEQVKPFYSWLYQPFFSKLANQS